MATDSWALAVDEQEAAAESLSNLHLKDEKGSNRTSNAVAPKPESTPKTEKKEEQQEDGVKGQENSEKEDDDDKEDKAAQSLLNKLLHSNLVQTKTPVEVLQKDPNSPLYSVKSFEELRLKPQLLKGVYGMGFNRPSKIQENALPMMLADP
ncbi:ATP-dependent RNA helicase DDX19B-like isoform X1 [Protopterus annectens]|uniref:ATP-dependent RNA helicase DDX19B-like isoform X1 n=1 Tax=Protopterus annectens TaxID=7888 RepID=UPI001CFA787E|nr:ATP-dependent RNA helicase DDX19B-like isoform X1 [Protopterus annectens]